MLRDTVNKVKSGIDKLRSLFEAFEVMTYGDKAREHAEVLARLLDVDPAVCLALRRLNAPLIDWRRYRSLEDSPTKFAIVRHLYGWLAPSLHDVRSLEETLPGALEAARDLLAAVRNGDRVMIYTDYDCDGLISGWLLREALLRTGAKPQQLFFRHSDNNTSFGVDARILDEARKLKIKWLVLLDCGSAAKDLVERAERSGIKVLIIDHHECDPTNKCTYHLNPNYINSTRKDGPFGIINEARRVAANGAYLREKQLTEGLTPDEERELNELSARGRELIKELRPLFTAEKAEYTPRKLQKAIEAALEGVQDQLLENNNSAAQLTWKFGRELLQQAGVENDDWVDRPMYLAGIAAMADMMPMDMSGIENRAFLRVPMRRLRLRVAGPKEQRELHSEAKRFRAYLDSKILTSDKTEVAQAEVAEWAERHHDLLADQMITITKEIASELVPPFVRELSDRLGEDISNPDSLVSTKAVINLAKRTNRIDTKDIFEGLVADDPQKASAVAAKLLETYEAIKEKRQVLRERVCQQWSGKADNEPILYALINDAKDLSGDARTYANALTQRYNKSSIVGMLRDDGLIKFSASSGPGSKIGEILQDPSWRSKLVKLCTFTAENGEDASSVGGHSKVLAGLVRPNRWPELVSTLATWEVERGSGSFQRVRRQELDDQRRPWVIDRFVDDERLKEIMHTQRQLFGPSTDFRKHPDIVVSVVSRADKIQPNNDPNSKYCTVDLVTYDGQKISAVARTDLAEGLQESVAAECFLRLSGYREPYITDAFCLGDSP